MGNRPISEGHRRWLAEELPNWQAAGMISGLQADQILSQYESAKQSHQRGLSWASWVLQAVSAVLVFLALLLLIGYNWSAMADAAKLITIFLVVISTYAAAFYLRFHRKAKLASEIAFLFGGLTYGAAIFLIAQIFHINAHYPDGYWWWAVGVVPLAIFMDQTLLHVLLALLMTIWSGSEVLGFRRVPPWAIGSWAEFPNIAMWLPVFVVPALALAHRRNAPLAVLLHAMALGWWIILQPYAWGLSRETVWFVGAVGAMMLIVAQAHFVGDRLAIPYRTLGILLTGGVLLLLSHYSATAGLLRGIDEERLGWWSFFVITILVAITFVSVESIRRQAMKRKGLAIPPNEWIGRQWLPLGLAGLMASMSLWMTIFAESYSWGYPNPKTMSAIFPTMMANAAILAVALWLIRLGVREGRSRPFSSGVITILIWAWVRYVDLFGELGGMLGASLMFLFSAVVLFTVARYWRGRKEVTNGANN